MQAQSNTLSNSCLGPDPGTLLAACDYRYSKSDVGWNNRNGLWQIDVVMKRSTYGHHGQSRSVWLVATRMPSIPSERLMATPASWQTAHPTTCCYTVLLARPVTKVPHAIILNTIFFHSQDGGLTWDNGTDLTEMIHGLYDGKLPNGGNADGLFLTSGRIMQSRYVRKGQFFRLYIAHPIRQRGVNRCGTFVIYSDDFGHTWNVLGNPATAPSIAANRR